MSRGNSKRRTPGLRVEWKLLTNHLPGGLPNGRPVPEYPSEAVTLACDLLYDRVLPFYQALGIAVGAVLTDNGRDASPSLATPGISTA